MTLIDPIAAIVVAICLLVIMLYKRLNLGIALTATAFILAMLVDWTMIPSVLYKTTVDLSTVTVVIATFGIMLLSQLYKETRVINRLSENIGKLINNPKAVLCLLPAVIGLLPVAGGALMSAPLVDTEADKLKLKSDKKSYINLWFRHTIFPVYPLSPPIITIASLTGVAIPLIILRQIPVVIVMVIVGYLIGFRNVQVVKSDTKESQPRNSHLRGFLISFLPIMLTIVTAIALEAGGLKELLLGFNVALAVFAGLVALIVISRMDFSTFSKPFKTYAIYGITLAAYSAFLLRNVMEQAGVSALFSSFLSNGSVDLVIFLMIVPAVLGLLTGSPVGGVAMSVSILAGILTVPFAPQVAGLIYISAYLGYTIAPTHLCFVFTAEYFKCSLGRVYRYVIPSFLATAATAMLVYFLL